MSQFWIVLIGMVVISGLLVAIWWVMTSGKKAKESQYNRWLNSVQTEEKEGGGVEELPEPVTAIIRDNFDGQKTYQAEISGEIVKAIRDKYGNLGGQWNVDGKNVFELCRIAENVYTPYENYLVKDRSNPPSSLYSYINQPEIAISRNVQRKESLIQKYGHLLLWCLAIAFIIFMMVASKGAH